MTTFVLVHGAWQGAWCWDHAVPLLTSAGHDVVAPTLTGSGDRADELTPDVSLDTHIEDVTAVVVGHDLAEVVLVGHSYSGMVITGVTERLAERIAALVFVDAFYPDDGQSALDQMPTPFQALFRDRAAAEGDGWRLPANDGLLDVWGLKDPGLRTWVRERLTDWSLTCFAAPLQVPAMRRRSVRRYYLAAARPDYPARAAFGPIAEKAAADGCELIDFHTGHDLMLERPGEFADALVARA